MAKILVVEDMDEYRSFTEGILNKAGHVTRWTDASEVALEYLRTGDPDNTPFDLVVLDVVELRRRPKEPARTPEGLRLLRQIRKDPKLARIPVIGVTRFLPEDDRETWRDLFLQARGGDAFFEQYLDPGKFINCVDKLLKSAQGLTHD